MSDYHLLAMSDNIYKDAAQTGFNLSVFSGVVAIGWYGALFASRRCFKGAPYLVIYRRSIKNPTPFDVIGLLPLMISAGTSFSSMMFYGMHVMEKINPT